MVSVEHREHPRYRVHWKASVIVELGGEKITHHGRTYDISLGGASFYTELSLFVKNPVTLLLSIPHGASEKDWLALEIKCRMVYTVLAANNDKFRIGLCFLSFKDGSRKTLENALSFQTPLST